MCQFSTVCCPNKRPAPKGSHGTGVYHPFRPSATDPFSVVTVAFRPDLPLARRRSGPGGSGASSGLLRRRLSPLRRLSEAQANGPTTPLRSLYVLCAVQYIGQQRQLSIGAGCQRIRGTDKRIGEGRSCSLGLLPSVFRLLWRSAEGEVTRGNSPSSRGFGGCAPKETTSAGGRVGRQAPMFRDAEARLRAASERWLGPHYDGSGGSRTGGGKW